jgi:hypothetical protein
VVWSEVGKASVAYVVGFSIYFLAVIVLEKLGIHAPEIQTTIWFVFTIIGVGVLSGQFLKWQPVDRVVAVGVLAGLTWLLVRVAER